MEKKEKEYTEYMEKHKLNEVFESLTERVVDEKPKELIPFLISELEGIKNKKASPVSGEETTNKITKAGCFDIVYSNLVCMYYFNGQLDLDEMQKKLDETIKDIPVLSGIITKDEKTEEIVFEHISPSNVKIASKKVPAKVFSLYEPNEEGLFVHEEGSELYKYFNSVDAPNPMAPVLNKELMKITLLETDEDNPKSILVVSINHVIADAHTLVYFVNKWSEREKFEIKQFDLSKKYLQAKDPDFDYKKAKKEHIDHLGLYQPSRPFGEVKEDVGIIFLPHNLCAVKSINFSKARLEELKKLVKNNGKKFSSNDCVSALCWKIHAAVSGNDPEQVLPFHIVVNIRERMEGVKKNFVGNGVINPNIDMKRKDILGSDFSDIVMKIRGLIERVDDDFMKTAIECTTKYKAIAGSLWRKTSFIMDDWRVVDTMLPTFTNKKAVRALMNPPGVPYCCPQMWFVNLGKNDGISIKATFQMAHYEKIKKLDLSDINVVNDLPKLFQ